jgi:internalin A
LKIIQSFGGDSPIIVVYNKCDEHSLDLNWKGLQEKYPTIKAFAKSVSCKTGEGIAELRGLIEQEVGQLEHIHDELILSWFAVKTQLEEMEADYIAYHQYQAMCQAEKISDELSQQTLLGFLHDLGIVLHFHDHPILEETNVLNPEWVTRGIYQILNSNELFQNKGELARKALDRMLDQQLYPRPKQQFILDMMRKFELCFDFAEQAGERFLVPDLLAKEEPYTGEWDESLTFQYHYDILPGSVISRFMVRMHAYIYKKTYWRNGVVLVSED